MKKKITISTILFILALTITSFCSVTMHNNMDYNTGMSSLMYSGLASMLETFAMVITIFSIISFVATLFIIVCNCLIFDMAGEKWWKAIIPIYNSIVLFRIIGLSPWLLLIYFTTFIPILNILGSIAVLILAIIIQIKLAKAFGKSPLFTLGLIFLHPIFIAILAFGDSKYLLGDVKANNDLFGEFDNKKDKKTKDPNKNYVIINSETGEEEEIDPRFYEPMDLTDYKPRSDFFNN